MLKRSLPAMASSFAVALCVACALACGGRAHAQCGMGDFDQSGVVDGGDLGVLLSQWGTAGGAGGADADLNNDSTVDGADLGMLLSLWGNVSTEGGTFPASWISGGPNCGTEPQIQVHWYNANFCILRQSLCTNFEAPFIMLIFGTDKVMMIDTGAGGIPIATTVYGLINQWLTAHGQASIQLIVTHTHGHGDHNGGNSQFTGQPNTTLVGSSLTAVKAFFGITTWPTQIVPYDLGGGRIVDIIPIPGHQSAHIAFYDRQTGLLLTGDTLYPGRLYISTFTDYIASIDRLVTFTANKPVCWVLGTHIEMSDTPTVDFPIGSTSHPHEHVLQLTRQHLLELQTAIHAMGATADYEEHADFIIYPL